MPRYLGQHFLVDQSMLQRIVAAVSDLLEESRATTMWEIGPGQGALTKHIWKLAPEFLCFEKDETMKKYLGQFLQEEHIVWGDVLKGKIQLHSSTIIVGNLPYYITSPIFRKFFTEDLRPTGGIFLIQKEVAEKIMTDAKKKSYLWWLVNNRYDIDYLFTVSPTVFDPPPKVESAVVRFILKENPIFEDLTEVEKFLDLVSGMKRKTLGKIQKIITKKGIDVMIPEKFLGKRLEELGWADMKEIIHNRA